MRIGLFTDTYPPFINGVSTSVQMLENSLRKKGHKVFIVTVNPEKMTYDIELDYNVILIPLINNITNYNNEIEIFQKNWGIEFR